MKKIVQLSASHNRGAIGKIMEQVGVKVKNELSFESWVIYGRYDCQSELKCIKMGNTAEVVEHYFENRFLDNEGLASRMMTTKIVGKLKEISPDIVHLHNIHDHWINYKILFDYLNEANINVVWTFHDCWAYTGGCFHFITVGCDKWKTECGHCPQRNRYWDRSKRNFLLKRKMFLRCKKLHIVTVSQWLKDVTEESFFCGNDIRVIHNGLDVNVFRPIANVKNIWNLPKGKFIVLGVATAWTENKGLNDYKSLAKKLGDRYLIVLVGMTRKQIDSLAKEIFGLPPTRTQEELSALYNLADVVVSMSKAETFGLTIAEGMACGTPGVVCNNTAQPELITKDTGIVVQTGDIDAAVTAIEKICLTGKSLYSESCRKLALERYDKDECYKKYLRLYEEILA